MADEKTVSQMTKSELAAVITGSVFKAHIGLGAMLVILALVLALVQM